MKRNRGGVVVLGLVALVLSGIALAADPVATISWTEVQSANRAVPTSACTSTTDGISLNSITAFHAVLRCTNGAAFTSGAALAYFCDPRVSTWVKAASYNDFTIPTSTGTLPDGGAVPSVGPELVVAYPFGRFMYAVDGGVCAGAGWDGGINVTIAAAQH
jgi:hypothetical protein